MIVKCNCQHCNGHIEFESAGFVAGTLASCPHCQMETVLFIPPEPAKPVRSETLAATLANVAKAAVASGATLGQAASKLQAPLASPSVVLDLSSKARVKMYLASIRANSSYSLLRGTVDVLFALSAFAACAYWLAFLFAFRAAPLSILLSLFLCALALALLFAFRQCALLLIDIADTLLHEHSKLESNRKP